MVITIESIPENSTLNYYKNEKQWLTSSKSKDIICEPLNDMIFLKKIHLPGRPHILVLVFSSHSLWLSFRSYTSMTTWMEKLSHITSKYVHGYIYSTCNCFETKTDKYCSYEYYPYMVSSYPIIYRSHFDVMYAGYGLSVVFQETSLF